MKIETRKVSELKGYAKNPRKNDQAVDAVANSIREFGFKVPLVIDKDNVVVAGHTRLKACRKLGIEEVPCVIADDLTEEQIKAFRLADNKTGELADWDFLGLADELAGIPDIDMADFGFTDEDFDSQSDIMEKEDPDLDIPEEAPYARSHDLFLLKEHRLYCGDSTSADSLSALLDGRPADMVITDPPYNVDYEGKNAKKLKIQNDKQKESDFYEFLFAAFSNMYSNTKPGGAIYCFHADTEGLNFRLAFQNAGYKLAECLVWVKNSLVLGRQDYQWRHEPCLYGWKEGAAHYFIDDRSQDTVLEFDRPQRSELHPTMKPIALFQKLIMNSSRRGELVLDPFAGSGTSILACERSGRRCASIELDPRYCDAIVKRFAAEVGGLDGCFLVRDGHKTPLSEIPEYSEGE